MCGCCSKSSVDRSAAWPCSKQRQAVSVGSTGPCGHASVCPRWWQAAAGELASVAVSEMARTACLGSGMGSAFANSLRRQQRNVCTSFQLFFSATRQDHGVGHRAQKDGAPVWLAPSPTWPARHAVPKRLQVFPIAQVSASPCQRLPGPPHSSCPPVGCKAPASPPAPVQEGSACRELRDRARTCILQGDDYW